MSMKVPYIFPTFRKQPRWDVDTILQYTHTRSTTSKHDWIFVLANILSGIEGNAIIDYKQDFQELTTKSYSALA